MEVALPDRQLEKPTAEMIALHMQKSDSAVGNAQSN